VPDYYASAQQKIAPRRSVALFALLAIAMVVVSYVVSPISSQAALLALVTLSGEWRTKYSFSASL
jgi:hypothetical protein